MKAKTKRKRNGVDLESKLRIVPGFPRPEVKFIDITTLLKDKRAFHHAVDRMTREVARRKADIILGIEARGFMLGAPIAYNLGLGFVPARKEGKLPATKLTEEYLLEYGKESLEIHSDAILPKKRVAVIDDLLATGGTAHAAARLVERMGASVSCIGFLVELSFLKGREKIRNYDVFSLISLKS